MRHYYMVDAIRDAEAPLLASLPDGALMRRAAYPLSIAIARELTARTGGISGRRICAVVGSGDNGGDALAREIVEQLEELSLASGRLERLRRRE